MSELDWQKSSYSNPHGQCVELSVPRGQIRDSKDPDGLRLQINVPAFLAAVQRGRFDTR